MQQRHQATVTQPLQYDLQGLSCKTQKNYAQRRRQLQLQNRISRRHNEKKTILKLFLKELLKGKLLAPKLRNLLTNHCRNFDAATCCRTQRRTAAPTAHRRYLSSPPAATLHGKTQGFVLRLPPQNKAHATFMQPLQCVSQHHFPSSPLPFVTTLPSSPLPKVTTSLRHHFPSSPLPVLTTSLHSLHSFVMYCYR